MADFEGLLARLIQQEVEFVVVGGFAAIAHGATSITQDIDICCRFSVENLLRLQQALADVHPVHRMTPQRIPLELTPAACKSLKNLYLDTDLGQLDCLGCIKGVGAFDDVKRRSRRIEMPIGICLVLDLQALIDAKKAMGRPRDNETVLQLEAIQERLRGSEPGE